MNSSDPLLLADGTLRYGIYPVGKVAISRHLVTPGIPRCDHTATLWYLNRHEEKFFIFIFAV